MCVTRTRHACADVLRARFDATANAAVCAVSSPSGRSELGAGLPWSFSPRLVLSRGTKAGKRTGKFGTPVGPWTPGVRRVVRGVDTRVRAPFSGIVRRSRRGPAPAESSGGDRVRTIQTHVRQTLHGGASETQR